MTEKAEKNKGGAGKFFLGAALGAVVGAVASKFIKLNSDDEADEDEEMTCPNCEKDGKECECHKAEKVAKEAVEKKPVKKTAEKK